MRIYAPDEDRIERIKAMAKKKYQVFVSSTFTDLKDERQSVSRAILNLGHIPAGMELFPATDTDQLSFIKKVIDDCDYYLLIIGGRYGSVTDEGLSYTELEYQYAVESKKPVLAFLHADTTELKSKLVESDPKKMEKLESFGNIVKTGRIVEFWTSIENLESKALVALTNAFNEYPQTGWRRDTAELSEPAQRRFDVLRERYDQNREILENTRKRANAAEERVKNYEMLEDSEIEIRFLSQQDRPTSIVIGAEVLIRELASKLARGVTYGDIEASLTQYILHKVDTEIQSISDASIANAALFLEVFEIATDIGNGTLRLFQDKKWLLKAAFKPLKKVISDSSDEIPF